MDFSKQELFFSQQRLSKYLLCSNGDQKKAMRLYKANLALSGALYTVLSNFEVCFRNAINKQLSKHFADNDWIINQRTGYMIDPRLDSTNPKYKFIHKKKIDSTINMIRARGKTPTSGMVISDQTLGFWTSYFEKKTYASVGGRSALFPIFTNLPVSTRRSAIYDRLEKIRALRNRIAHHEPICFINGTDTFSLLETEKVYNLIYEILGWMDSDLKDWIKKIDSVKFHFHKTKLCSTNRSSPIHYGKLSVICLRNISTR